MTNSCAKNTESHWLFHIGLLMVLLQIHKMIIYACLSQHAFRVCIEFAKR
jgi:hypothetical protein